MESISRIRTRPVDLWCFDPVTAGLGVGGLLLQNQANNQAKSAANKATGKQKDLVKRQTELFDTIRGIVGDHDKAGGFDPQKQLQQLETDTAYYSSRDMGNSATAARTLGYKRGDSAPLSRLRSIDSSYKLQYGQMANQIRESAFGDKLSAYRAIDPSSLNPGIQTYGSQSQMAMGQQQPLSGMAGAIQPFLGGQSKATVQQKPVDWSFVKNLRF